MEHKQQEQEFNIGDWIDREISRLNDTEIEALANEKLEKLKDFVSPEIYDFLAPDTASASKTTQSKPSSGSAASTSALHLSLPPADLDKS